MTNNSLRLTNIILAALFAAITAVCSQVQIPLAPVPVNLGTFALFLAGGLLGSRYGSLSILIYLLLGAVGVPVFAGFKGGLGVLAGPTGGYLAGYLICTFVTGLVIEKFSAPGLPPKYIVLVAGMILGLLCCYILGTAWFMHLSGLSLGKALTACVVVFLPGDALKIATASLTIRKIRPAINRQ